MKIIDLSGEWSCELPGLTALVRLPGTLDERGVGFPDSAAGPWHPDAQVNGALAKARVIATRLTRKHTFRADADVRQQLFGASARRHSRILRRGGRNADQLERRDRVPSPAR